MDGKFVAYYRVSTARQGLSGLGLEAQRSAVMAYLNGGNWKLVGEFVEVESGGDDDRPQLAAAISTCHLKGATLIIAKLDRLSRDVHFLTGLERQGIDFIACDMPKANRLTVHIMAAVAQQEREAVSARTKAALDEIKRRLAEDGAYTTRAGKTITRLGGSRSIPTPRPDLGVAAIKTKADAFAKRVMPVIEAHKAEGLSLAAIAAKLNEASIPTSRGATWTPMAVKRVLERAA
jgi:DNA invertase Pin-like site-specific DNA recombinase